MPRPRTYAQSVRTQTITIRITPELHARLTTEARQIGISIAGLAERYLAKGTIRIEASSAPPPLPPVLAAELKRIGNNLNQLAHAANAGLPLDAMRAAASLRDLIHLMAKDELLAQRVRAVRERAPPP